MDALLNIPPYLVVCNFVGSLWILTTPLRCLLQEYYHTYPQLVYGFVGLPFFIQMFYAYCTAVTDE